MKEFKKTNDRLFICEECNRSFNNHQSLGKHISQKHNLKNYYNKYLKEESEGLCKICGKETKFVNLVKGYLNTCSKKCKNIYCYNKNKMGMKEKYGVEHNFQRKEIREKIIKDNKKNQKYPFYKKETQNKIKENNFKIYGLENQFQREEVKEHNKQIKKERYGDEYYNNPEKNKQTCLEHFGVEHSLQSKEIQEKFKQTCFNNNGVEWPMQNREIFEKAQKSGYKIKYFKNTDIYYRGTYEFDFLEKYYPLFPNIMNAKSIKYFYENKEHYYHPDFYIPSLNLIIEIKSEWTIKQQGKEKINAKEKAIITNGFKYLVIIEKDYNKFDKLNC